MTEGVGNPAYEGSTDTLNEPSKSNQRNSSWNRSSDTLTSHVDDRSYLGDGEENSRCGYGPCTPNFLQGCNNPKMVLFWISWFAFVQGFVVNGINNVNTTTIERRFNLQSSQVGLISSSYDIAAGLTVLPVTYYGTFAHQPRMLSLAAFVMALGSWVMSLPHFTTSLYDYGQGEQELCVLDNSTTTCDESSSLSNYLYVFILGQLLHGLGGSVLYTTGVVYIDSNVKTKNSPLYQGLMLASSTVGPAVGYLLGGMLLEFYVDLDSVDTSAVTLTSSDPRWVGAWWIGFVCSGTILLTVVVGIYPYPKLTPAGHHAQKDRQSQSHNNGCEEICQKRDFLKSWRDAPVALKILVTNPVFMFCALANVTETMVTAGFATFLPKIIQNQFSQTAGWAALLAGFVAVPGTVLGNVLGGGIMKCLQLKVKGMLRFCIILTLMAAVVTFVALCKCDFPDFAGLTVNYDSSGPELSTVELNSTCNMGCGCTLETYRPVCGANAVQYFSPCHAGCMNVTGDSKNFTECACVAIDSVETYALDETCEAPCDLLPVFLPLFSFIIMLTFMAGVPGLNVTLRCIPDKQRSFGLGVNAVMFRFLGTFPGPLLFGAIFDNACLVWQESCDAVGSCWVYDNDKLAVSLLVVAMVIKLVSATFFSIAYCFYKPPPEEDQKKAADNVAAMETISREESINNRDISQHHLAHI